MLKHNVNHSVRSRPPVVRDTKDEGVHHKYEYVKTSSDRRRRQCKARAMLHSFDKTCVEDE
jgi:hypothetical protein